MHRQRARGCDMNAKGYIDLNFNYNIPTMKAEIYT
jgi:hypothetical protein